MKDGVYISTYGCQMNVNDSERMYALLEMMNFEPVSTPEQASLIIINSCSVREKPVHKVWSEAGHYRKLKQKNPNLKIGVAGCVAQQEKGQLLKDIPVLDFVVGTDHIDRLPLIVQEVLDKSNRVVSAKFEHSQPYQIQTMISNPGVSTFVNIMKGCDNFCTFCVVPFTRGRERSRPMMDIINDVNGLVKRGVKEITLLGQNVNSYKSPCGATFPELLQAVVETDIQRIRYTSPHPKDFTRALAEQMQAGRHKLMEYLHMPLQSGNTEILEKMNRGYTREEFIEKSKMLLEVIPGAVLSTDIIVGFPGETEEQFLDTLKMLDEVPFDMIYAFKYSPRPFTKAADYGDQLDEATKSDRLTRLLAKHREQGFISSKKYEGQILQVLVENYHENDGSCFGRSTQNKSVHFPGTKDDVGQTLPILIREAYPQTLHGEIVRPALPTNQIIDRTGAYIQ
ncbi:MAG: tRNA (N6-isopentenyl adenosine(37)-C2)-methylthiotransferase MiaB [Bdellovibrionota bacterium]